MCCGQELAMEEARLDDLETKRLTPEEKAAKKLDGTRARVEQLPGFMEKNGTPAAAAVKTFGISAPLIVAFSAAGTVRAIK